MKKIFLILFFPSIFCFSWEEDPRIEEHLKWTDYLLKIGNDQYRPKERELEAYQQHDGDDDEDNPNG